MVFRLRYMCFVCRAVKIERMASIMLSDCGIHCRALYMCTHRALFLASKSIGRVSLLFIYLSATTAIAYQKNIIRLFFLGDLTFYHFDVVNDSLKNAFLSRIVLEFSVNHCGKTTLKYFIYVYDSRAFIGDFLHVLC